MLSQQKDKNMTFDKEYRGKSKSATADKDYDRIVAKFNNGSAGVASKAMAAFVEAKAEKEDATKRQKAAADKLRELAIEVRNEDGDDKLTCYIESPFGSATVAKINGGTKTPKWTEIRAALTEEFGERVEEIIADHMRVEFRDPSVTVSETK